MSLAICPGSFDPITLGHLNIIRRTARIFDKVIVLITVNASKKSPMFTLEERESMTGRVCARFKNVTVESSDELLAEYARNKKGAVIVKGLRANMDFENEFQMAQINKTINPELETMFLTSSEKYTFISSSMVKEIAGYGADISDFIPREILKDVEERAMSGRVIHG